jgi:hypothetical protein
MYTHICKCKNDTFETVPGITGGGVKKSSEFKYDIFDTLEEPL